MLQTMRNEIIAVLGLTIASGGALVEQAAAASQAIVEQAQSLNALMARYQVGEEAVAAATPIERRSVARPWSAGAPKAPARPARAAERPALAPRASAPRRIANAGEDTEWKEF